MAYKVVLIENEVQMKVRLNNLVIFKEDQEITISLDDISMIVMDNLKTSFTARLMVQLAEKNIGVIICNQEHHPIGYYSSYDNHSRISKLIMYQINKPESFYDSLWKTIVENKISNQAKAIRMINKSEDVSVNISNFAKDIVDGDITNREAHAAKVYFNEMMGSSFSRGNEDILLNSGLDYGYSIIRAYIARLCVGYGMNTQIGIHHKNEYNRFNLVDDIIEPIRPIVDIYAYKLLESEKYFMPEHRRKLANILNHYIEYEGRRMYVANMIEEYVISYERSFKEDKNLIKFPDINLYEVSDYEV